MSMSTPLPFASSESKIQADPQNSHNGEDQPVSLLSAPHLAARKLRKIPPIPHHGALEPNSTRESSSEDEHRNVGTSSSPIVASSLGLNQIRTRFTASPLQFSSSFKTPCIDDVSKKEKLHQLPIQSGRAIPLLTHAKSLKFPPNFTPGLENYHAAFAKEIQSPRFQAIMRLTSGRKKNARDIKSFSHELSSKGVRPYPYWKPRASGHMEEIIKVIKAKFDRLKEEVDADLGVFAGDLVGILEGSSASHPEWKDVLEDLLVTARHCAKMSAKEFWFECEDIVQMLDDRRQDLPAGILKQTHTRILFILTRCTRLVQFQRESDHEEDRVLGPHQLSHLGGLSEYTIDTGHKNLCLRQQTDESRDRYQKNLQNKPDLVADAVFSGIDDDEGSTATSIESTASSYKMSSWKKFPSPIEQNRKNGHDLICSTSNISPYLWQGKNERGYALHDNLGRINIPLTFTPDISTSVGRVSWGPSINQKIMVTESSIICRICEVEIPTLHVEAHSKICTIVDRCDLKSLTVNQRIERVAEILERILLSWTPKSDDTDGGSPEVDGLSPRHIDLADRLSEEFLEYSREAGSSFSVDDLNVSAYLSSQGHSIVHDLRKESSLSGSLTPRSPLPLSRTNQIEFLLSGHTISNDDFKQILKLLRIARSIADANECSNATLEYLLDSLDELKYVLRNSHVDGLVVDTFGKHIEKILQEKYVQLCGQIEEDKFDSDNGSLVEEDPVHSLRASPVNTGCKDRTSIEDFEIIKPISRGAYGRVFLAKKRATGDLFAIKVLKKVDMIRKNAVDSILAERDILISARNPFMVRFFYSFTCRENLYLVMEYLNGGDLYSLLKNLGCLDEDMARIYVAEIVLALEYLHSLNVIHRDLKPDNLLIGADGHVKLTDFGLSKVGLINSTDELSGSSVSSSTSVVVGPNIAPKQPSKREHRQKHVVVGTPDYLAPEILLGMGHGSTADWWSVGVILFELLVGVPPFNAQTPQQIFDNVMNRDIPWPKIPDELSFEAYDLIDKLLSENSVQRLGATGAGEVKRHPFFKGINWETVARQKAMFIPSLEGVEDTSYFMSRCICWEDESSKGSDFDDSTETCSLSYSSSSLVNIQDEYGDECGNLAYFGSPPTVKYPFSNFSFKNLSQLASINYDLLHKKCKESPESSKTSAD